MNYGLPGADYLVVCFSHCAASIARSFRFIFLSLLKSLWNAWFDCDSSGWVYSAAWNMRSSVETNPSFVMSVRRAKLGGVLLA